VASRREFLQAGLMASFLPIAVSAAESESDIADQATPFYKVVFDERFPASVAFGEEWRARGTSVHAIRGDITDLWFHDLELEWKKRPAPVAGLTAHGPLFCLERLAWDKGMRVVFRVAQGTHDGEDLFTWIIATKEWASKEWAHKNGTSELATRSVPCYHRA
jgi:hypothetical protein